MELAREVERDRILFQIPGTLGWLGVLLGRVVSVRGSARLAILLSRLQGV